MDAAWNKQKQTFVYLNDTKIKGKNVVDKRYMELKSRANTYVDHHAVVYGNYSEKGNFTLKGGSANMKSFTVCRAYPLTTPGIKTLNSMLDPSKALYRANKTEAAKKKYHKDFDQINITKSYNKIFELLWYTKLPCFDVKGITSQEKDEMSVIKRCYWRGEMVDCASIFVTRSTDRGMCCTFNLGQAEKIFKDTRYRNITSKLQQQDRKLNFANSKSLGRYVRTVIPYLYKYKIFFCRTNTTNSIYFV